MSAAKVWANGAWKTVDTKGPPGDIGTTGANGTNTLTATGMTFTATIVGAGDGLWDANGLAVSGATSAAPCMTVSGGNKLAAVLAGMYAIAMFVDLSAAAVSDDGNWFAVSRMVADASGTNIIASGDIPKGIGSSSTNALGWLSAGEVVQCAFSKNTGGACNITWVIRAVMLQ